MLTLNRLKIFWLHALHSLQIAIYILVAEHRLYAFPRCTEDLLDVRGLVLDLMSRFGQFRNSLNRFLRDFRNDCFVHVDLPIEFLDEQYCNLRCRTNDVVSLNLIYDRIRSRVIAV